MYKIYILKCSDNTLYTWITTDLKKRLRQHNWELLGWAKYTLSRKPVELIYSENSENRSTASKREYEIKKLTREKKMKLIEKMSTDGFNPLKKQIILVKWWESKENYKDYYEFLEKQKYDPFKEEVKRWNRNLWEKLWKNYEILVHKTFNKDYSDYKSWKIMFEKMFPFFEKNIIFVGHSMWAIFLAKYFEEEKFYTKLSKLDINILKIILIAPPFKDIKNDVLWDFNFENTEFKNLKKLQDKIKIFASKDDFVVPFEDIEDYKKALPKVEYSIFEDRWHFLQEEFLELIEEIKK
jgi:predicted GIY-YIG superfamily endonuclease/predicted alpha/beta hydrolase family esterase